MKLHLVSFLFGRQNKQKAKLVYHNMPREYKLQNPGASDSRR